MAKDLDSSPPEPVTPESHIIEKGLQSVGTDPIAQVSDDAGAAYRQELSSPQALSTQPTNVDE